MKNLRVEQPEVGDIGGGEVGEALIFLAAGAGELRATGSEDFDDAAKQSHDVFVGADVEEGRNEAWA